MLFSIIIPVFNVAEYLPQAIDSVLGQDCEDLQVILVNDGSTDDSLSICQEFKRRDSRVDLVDQVNHGVSAARNAGLGRAKGTYVLFLDGDDFMEPGALSALYQLLSRHPHLDLVTCAHREVHEGATVLRPVPDGWQRADLSRREYLEAFRAGRMIPWAVWKNAFKTEVILRSNLQFDSSLVRSEDALFFADFVGVSKKFGTLQYPIVNYRIGHPTSAMQQDSSNHLKSRLVVRAELFGRALKVNQVGDGDFRPALANMFA